MVSCDGSSKWLTVGAYLHASLTIKRRLAGTRSCREEAPLWPRKGARSVCGRMLCCGVDEHPLFKPRRRHGRVSSVCRSSVIKRCCPLSSPHIVPFKRIKNYSQCRLCWPDRQSTPIANERLACRRKNVLQGPDIPLLCQESSPLQAEQLTATQFRRKNQIVL